MATFSTNFDSSENPLSEGGNIGSAPGGWGGVQKVSGEAQPTAIDTDSAGRWNANDFALAHYSETVIGNIDGSGGAVFHQTMTRMVNGGNDGDGYDWAGTTTGALRMYRVDDTGSLSFVQLGSDVVETPVNGDTMKLTANGTSHEGFRNGASKLTQTDATYNTNGTHTRVGCGFFATTATSRCTSTSWSGGDLTFSSFAKTSQFLLQPMLRGPM